MPAENREEYLEAIYSLNECKLDASTSQIAKHLQISSASVTQMLKKLDSEGLIRYKPYKGAKLTKKGTKLAKGLKRKYRLLEIFLHDVLGVRKDKIHDEACKLEHGLSDEATDALDRVLGHPTQCPDDGKLIPRDDMVSKNYGNSLMNMRSGETAKIIKLGGGELA